MPLTLGSRLGPYTVDALIGEGGMGQVDTHASVVRFQREAQVLVSLNHPSIAAIHGLEVSDHVHVMGGMRC